MKRSIKILEDIGGLPDLRTYTGSVRKSAKPPLPTTAILDLYMRRHEKDRIGRELKRLKKRRGQLMKRLTEVEKDLDKLVNQATQTAIEIRGESKKRKVIGKLTKKGRTILGY